jgi:ribosome-binding ATPase
MRLGIIGLPNSGKTTIFNALTGQNLDTTAVTSGQFEVHTAIVTVPDERLNQLNALYNPKKTTFANITYTDIGGLDKGISDGGLKGQFKAELSQVDGFVHVVRVFESDIVPHPYETIDPPRDVETLDGEFLLADLVTVENRISKLEDEIRIKGKKLEAQYADEIALLNRMKAHLEDEKPLRDMELTDDEFKPLSGFGLLTIKPVMVVLNMGDEAKDPASILSYDHQSSRLVGLQGQLEAEISQLDSMEDAEMFMEEYGITELSAAKVIRVSYDLMEIQSFFTVGEDECRAWSIKVGTKAPEAAGTIHTDLQKGFIRAEVMSVELLIELGSEAAVKKAGKMHLEGKDYVVQEGDVVHVRFNI